MTSHPTTQVAPLNMDTSRDDMKTIIRIADRAMSLEGIRQESWIETTDGRSRRVHTNAGDIAMDVTAVHCNGNPLRLDALLAADDFNFAHDIYGIRRNLNRATGDLENFWTPRFSA